jgi:delta 1-pyrroline-5-carboxylate dehydrogenase
VVEHGLPGGGGVLRVGCKAVFTPQSPPAPSNDRSLHRSERQRRPHATVIVTRRTLVAVDTRHRRAVACANTLGLGEPTGEDNLWSVECRSRLCCHMGMSVNPLRQLAHRIMTGGRRSASGCGCGPMCLHQLQSDCQKTVQNLRAMRLRQQHDEHQ